MFKTFINKIKKLMTFTDPLGDITLDSNYGVEYWELSGVWVAKFYGQALGWRDHPYLGKADFDNCIGCYRQGAPYIAKFLTRSSAWIHCQNHRKQEQGHKFVTEIRGG